MFIIINDDIIIGHDSCLQILKLQNTFVLKTFVMSAEGFIFLFWLMIKGLAFK